MADSMIQYALQTPDLRRRGVVEVFAATNQIAQRLKFIDLAAATGYTYNRESALPGIGFRSLGADYSAAAKTNGVWVPGTEPTCIMGGEVRVDRTLAKNPAYVATQLALKAKAAAAEFAYQFFYGNQVASPNSFDGLQRRLAAANITYAGNNGGVMDTDALSEMIAGVPGEAGQKVLFASELMRILLGKLLRAKGATTMSLAEWQGELRPLRYDGVEIVVPGEDRSGNPILGFGETRGTSDVTGSIYCCRLGESLDGEYLQGIASNAVSGIFAVEPRGMSGAMDLWIAEAQLGLVIHHPRCVKRYAGILNATS